MPAKLLTNSYKIFERRYKTRNLFPAHTGDVLERSILRNTFLRGLYKNINLRHHTINILEIGTDHRRIFLHLFKTIYIKLGPAVYLLPKRKVAFSASLNISG